MKLVSEKLNAHLNMAKHFKSADLYHIATRDGQGYYFTNASNSLSYNGRLYRADFVIIERTKIQTHGKVEVDTLNVKISANAADKMGGKPLHQFAHDGGLDRGRLALSRVFFDDDFNPIGHIALFNGVMEVKAGGGLTLELTVKADTQGLAAPFPKRRYYPQAPYGAIAGKDSGTALIAPFVPTTEALY